MPYLSLPNFKYDSGPRRIQSGPNHEGYVVLYSGVQSTGPDEGIVVAGAPLSGTLTQGAWDYDANWRYVPLTLGDQSSALDPTPYNVSSALDTYDATRIYTRNTVAGAQIASAIGSETGKINPRGAALQPRANVTQPEKYMYYGGAAPDNQNYSPYNTPNANSPAEGKTGGGVTHKTFESSLLTNVLGSQGTSDRSQWRYHQPVYCKTYTETKRSEAPGLMSTPLRAVYRGGSTSYNYNYGSELLANTGGFSSAPAPGVVIADYYLIEYVFTTGLDLDTRTTIQNPSNGSFAPVVGWCKNDEIIQNGYETVTWGGDNTGVGVESVLFDRLSYELAFPGSDTAILSLSAFWFSQLGSSVTISITGYRGGTMVKTPFSWENPTATTVWNNFSTYTTNSITTNVPSCVDGEFISFVIINYSLGTVTYSPTPSV
jgi:hypothetical protein